MNELLNIFILFAPTIYEAYEDRKGDKHPNLDWAYRGGLMIGAAALVATISPWMGVERNFFRSFALTFGIFTFFFPYLINIVHKKKKWWDSLSDTAIPDKWTYWRLTPWPVRMFILAIFLGIGLTLYFWKEYMAYGYSYGI